MPAPSVDLVELVRRLADRRRPRSEADIQTDVRTLLLYGGLDLKDGAVALESPVTGGRRIDVEIGFTVIEVKKDLTVGRVKEDAEEQLTGYVRARSNVFQERYVGVLTDGCDWYAYHLSPAGKLDCVAEFRVAAKDPDVDGLLVWLEGVLATQQGIRPTPANIVRRLGAHSPSHLLDKASLLALYGDCKLDSHVKLKRDLWARLLATAYGTHFSDDDQLFVDHTYLVISAELIAHAVLGFDLASGSYSPDDLLSGRLFDQAEIGGVVEADFFDWVLEAEGGRAFVRTLARRLSRFDWKSVEHDVLKVLYESVIDPIQRHELGEYYTPDWLAERMVHETITAPLTQRVLDPSCGSGTFLFHAVRRYLDHAGSAEIDDAAAMKGVTQHVFGVDIHPVAVTLARVTYLLAIGSERLQGERGPLAIPVYLGDSLQWHQGEDLLSSSGDLTVSTADGSELWSRQLRFPNRVVADVSSFDRLVSELATKASTGRSRGQVPSLTAVFRRHGVHPDDQQEIAATFQILCDLYDEGRDHIWGYYVRNLARPRWLSNKDNRVDVLIGNPPWLAYRYMPSTLQGEFKTRSSERGLWAGGNVANIQDLSSYFVVRSAELYLSEAGKFAFVMPLAALTRKQYKGFRSGKYDSSFATLRFRFTSAWDHASVKSKPAMFPVPSCAVFGQLSETAGPLGTDVVKWSGTLPARDISWERAAEHLHTQDGAVARGTAASAYRARFANGATIYPQVLSVVEVAQSAGPLGASSGRKRVKSSRSNQEKPPWKSVDTLTGFVEERFIYPAYFGSSILPFRRLMPETAVLPIHHGDLMHGKSEEIDHFPGLAEWWRKAEQIWLEGRPRGSRMDLRQRLDFQRNLTNQLPVRGDRLVYNKSGSILVAARIPKEQSVVDQQLLWGVFPDPKEALYLESVFNSRKFTELVAPFQSVGQFGRRDFSKDVFSVQLPLFDPSNDVHMALANLAVRGEEVAAGVDIGSLRSKEARGVIRDALADCGLADEIDELVTEAITG
ncbi:N-6 DNA methylase [Micromonospora sp. 4G55]|uniref:N-6 DNA methylase n=1 Tax=Micromonospora sp. 4G55 TaxID=2806102 RepID=UPI001A577070|nr:N-6 DNA methylase [Micromonospora sp. 4G55]MBM0256833.1 N-6 DNA methylase [Micromonospora sp. 4G55]